jgi:dihydropteroate synthase
MTGIPRPRLLQACDGPAGELRRAGFHDVDVFSGWRMILWEHLSPNVLEAIAQTEHLSLRRWTARSSVLLAGGPGDFHNLATAIEARGLNQEAALLIEVVTAPSAPRNVRIPGGGITFENTCIVGILNVTPDSFFDGGRYNGTAEAIRRATVLEAEGAAIIEVGGERAGPGELVSEEEELRRVMPVIAGIRENSDIIVSVDTWRPQVARQAIAAGVHIVNDINGMRDPEMRKVVAGSSVAVVVMHIQGVPRVHQPNPIYGTVIGDVTQFLHEQIQLLEADGIKSDYVIIDPGPGFGKTTEQDFSLLRHLSELRGFPRPVMLSVSRKRFIGPDVRPEERLEGSIGVTAFAVAQGVEIVRTHDVAATKKAVSVVDSVKPWWDDCEW